MSTSSNFHNANSNTYDRMACGATSSIAEQLLPLLPSITPESRVLDNACGTGVVTEVIKAADPSAHITGADLSPNVLEIYQSKASQNNWENTQTEVLDVRDLNKLKDESFSHVVTNFGFVNTPDDQESPLQAAKEMYRVTAKDGVTLITIWADNTFLDLFYNASKTIRPNHEPFSWKQNPQWKSDTWLKAQLFTAGFGHVEVKPLISKTEAGSLDELIGNLCLAKGMFCKDWSADEVGKLEDVMREGVEGLEHFYDDKGHVGFTSRVWAAIASK